MTSNYENPVSIIDHDGLPQAGVVISSVTIHEGDLVVWDETNFTFRPMLEPTDAEAGKNTGHAGWKSAGFAGIAVGSNKPEIYGGEEALPSVPILSKATVFLLSTNAQKYKPFEAVKLGADSQTVSNSGVAAGTTIGYVILDPPAAARAEQATPVPEEFEGATGVRIRVLLKPTFAPASVI